MNFSPTKAWPTDRLTDDPNVASSLAYATDGLETTSAPTEDPVIVVGAGPSGLRVAQEVLRRGLPVVLFNAERWRPYNRLKLTPFLSGEVQLGFVYQRDVFTPGMPIVQRNGQTIEHIDRAGKSVVTQHGRCFYYSKLILCLGSRPYIPPFPGRELKGVFRFRDLDDVEFLLARAVRSRSTVVIGGGLLGLEAARGMALRGVKTTIVEHETHLMARQLDRDAGLLLADEIRRIGLDVRTSCSVKSIGGSAAVEHVLLSTGEEIACDTVIICTGIRSNIELASVAGLAVGRGITVNDNLQTSDPNIYAVGECAEHDGNVYGLVAPGLEQAAVAAAHLAGDVAAYRGSVLTTKLKAVGIDVFSMGDVEQIDQRTDIVTYSFRDPTEQTYRRLVTLRGRLVGALGVGEWPEVNRIQQAVRDRVPIWPWQLWRFTHHGRLFPTEQLQSVTVWPTAATVCNCTGVTRGQLGDAISRGVGSVEALMRETSASTVCGTCRPLLQELMGHRAAHAPILGARAVATGSLIAVLLALAAIALPHWPYAASVQGGPSLDWFWLNGTVKQVTGFTLVGLSAIVAFLSLRKRIGWKWLGSFPAWRVVHVVVGAATLAALFFHTGFNLGHNLNRWLMTTFLALIMVGSLTGIVTAREHIALAAGRTSWRGPLTWMHIFAFWPLPVLLFIHVVAVYAY